MQNIEIINFNNYVMPDIKVVRGTKFLTNGKDNIFFKYIKDRYIGSPTNAGIINSYVKYIYGDGLVDINGENIEKYISKKDLKLICLDFKLFGQYSVMITWSQGSKILNESPIPIKIKHIPTNNLALNVNDNNEVDGYHYSFDWTNKVKYAPRLFTKFDGTYDENNPIQILTINRISINNFFPMPDYISGLQYAQMEEELSNSSISHIGNNFSAGTIINCVGGKIPTDEARRQITETIKNKWTGSSNQKKIIVNFSDSIDENQISVQNVEVTQLDAQLVYFSEEAQRKIFIAHSVTSPSLFGVIQSTGFSSSSDDRVTAIAHLMQNNINPMREEIIDGLEEILKISNPDIALMFKDFELENKNNIKE